VFFNGGYPFIDLSSGGSIDGVIAATATALGYANAETKIIPGHGPLGNKGDLQAYNDMVSTVYESLTAKKPTAGKPAKAAHD